MIKAVNIQWDIDSPEELSNLPNEVIIPLYITDDEKISDYISDISGFCHKGFETVAVNPDELYIGIVYNYKGIKEENYLYTVEELLRYDGRLAVACMEEPRLWHDASVFHADKTWVAKLMLSQRETELFLKGEYNEESSDSDWYWENVMSNDLYGVESNTMMAIYGSLIIKGSNYETEL